MSRERTGTRPRRNRWLVVAGAVVVLGAVAAVLAGAFGDDDVGDVVTLTGRTTGAAAEPLAPSARARDSAPTEIEAAAAVREPAAAEEAPAGPPASWRAALAGVVGRVVEEDGSPVPGLPVEIAAGRASTIMTPRLALLTQSHEELELIAGSGVTDADGRFAIDGIHPRVVGMLLLDPGGPRASMRWLESTPVSGGVRDLGDIVLAGRVTLAGRIADERGEPIAGARVRPAPPVVPHELVDVGLLFAEYREGAAVVIHPPELSRPLLVDPPASIDRAITRLPVPTAFTDAEGRFEVEVPVGVATLVADDGLHVANSGGPYPTGAAGGTRDVGEIRLPDGITLSGTVVDRDGKPVPDAEVRAGNTFPLQPIVSVLREPVRSGPDGRFAVRGLRPESAFVAARGPDEAEHTFLAGLQPEAPVRVVLPGDARVTVRAQDASGRPVEGVRFFGRGLLGEELDEMLPAYVSPVRPLDDFARLEEPGVYVLEGLTPIQWHLVGEAPGFGVARASVDLAAQRDTTATMVFEPAHALAVTVLAGAGEQAGEPVEWAEVSIHDDEDLPLLSTRTDAAGRATLAPLPPNEYTVVVLHPGFALQSREVVVPDTSAVEVTLPLGGTIRGTVLDNGEPPADPVLVLLDVEGRDAPDAELPRMALTDAEGRFSFHQIEPGDAEVVAHERILDATGFQLFDAFMNSPLARADVAVPAEGEVEVLLVLGSAFDDMETATVQGRLLVNGAPAGAWRIRCWGDIRRSITTESDGTFDLGLVAAGDATLVVSAPGTGMAWAGVAMRQLVLEPDERRYVEIAVATGSVSGSVRSAGDGRGLEGAEVQLQRVREPEDGRTFWAGGQTTLAASDGSFTFDMAEEGTYSVRAALDGYAAVTSETFELRALQHRGGVEILLSPSLRIAGRVVFEGIDEPPDWVFLMAWSKDGAVRDNTRPDPETMEFEFASLGSGTYEFRAATGADVEFEVLERTITGDTDSLVLVFRPAPEEPPEEEPEEIEEVEEG